MTKVNLGPWTVEIWVDENVSNLIFTLGDNPVFGEISLGSPSHEELEAIGKACLAAAEKLKSNR
jgi:hypothetical protein